MKKTIIILSFLLPFSIMGQENSNLFEKNNALKISVFEFGKAEFQVSYERYFNDRKSSIIITPSIILKKDFDSDKEGWSIMGQYRFYLSHFNKRNHNTFLGFENYSLYTSLYSNYLRFSEDYNFSYWDNTTGTHISEKQHKELTGIEGGALVGMQIDFSKRVVLDMYAGGGIKKTDLEDTLDRENPDIGYYNSYGVFDREYEGVKPKIGFQIGITF